MRLLIVVLVGCLALAAAQDEGGPPPEGGGGGGGEGPPAPDEPCHCKGRGDKVDYYTCGATLNAEFGNENCKEKFVYLCFGPDGQEVPTRPKTECKHLCHAVEGGGAGCKRA